VAGHAHTSEAKSNAGVRSLALDPETLAALSRYVERWEEERRLLGQSSRLLFVWPSGGPLHPDTITATFHRHCQAAGLPRIRLHDVRHSYATAALIAGVSPKIISERLGHSTVAFTLQTYAHVIPTMDEAAAATAATPSFSGPVVPRNRMAAFLAASPRRKAKNKTGLGQSPRPAVVAGAGFEPATSGL